MMWRGILLIILSFISLATPAEITITPSDVYAQVLLIDRETDLVRQHFQADKKPLEVKDIIANLQPQHVSQKCYMLQMKLIAFRRKHNLYVISPVGLEPVAQSNLLYTWEQTQRVLTELRIIRKMLGITGEIDTTLPVIKDKNSIDVFNKLNEIEAKWDSITGSDIDASYTFNEVLRLNEDVNIILRQLDIFDNAPPPAKVLSDTPAQALDQAFLLLEQVQRVQRLANMEVVDLSAFHKQKDVKSTNVFNIVCLILVELQQIKVRIGLKHYITPSVAFRENKQSADVRQLLGYITNKLALIQHL